MKGITIVSILLLASCNSVTSPLVRITTKVVEHESCKGVTIAIGSGTGFFVGRDGIIATAAHVVKGSCYIRVTIEGRKMPVLARVLASDSSADIALLKLPGVKARNPLAFCSLDGYSEEIAVNLSVRAWRSYRPEQTRGALVYLTQEGRSVSTIMSGPGFSGSPVLDTARGCVIGVLARSNMQADDPLTLAHHPLESPGIISALRKHAPESLPE